MKRGSLLKLNHYLNKVLADADPENEVEEQYRNKHDQAFCWKFIRAVSYTDIAKFNNFVKKPSNITASVEQMASSIHTEAKKREIDETKEEEMVIEETMGSQKDNMFSEMAQIAQVSQAVS